MPDRVAAVEGASLVEFPWVSATYAVSVLSAVACELGAHIESRAAMSGGLASWRGGYRDEFDATYAALVDASSGIVESLTGRAVAVADAARAANREQTRRNDAAVVDNQGRR